MLVCVFACLPSGPDDGNVSLSKFGGVHLAAFPAACGQCWGHPRVSIPGQR